MAKVALAWSLSKPFISAPIVGTTSIDKLKELIGGFHYLARSFTDRVADSYFPQRVPEGIQVKLTEEEVKAIDDLYRPRAISGHR